MANVGIWEFENLIMRTAWVIAVLLGQRVRCLFPPDSASFIRVGGDGDKDVSIFRKSYKARLYEAYSLVVLLYCFQQFFCELRIRIQHSEIDFIYLPRFLTPSALQIHKLPLYLPALISTFSPCPHYQFSNFQILKLSSHFLIFLTAFIHPKAHPV